MPFGDQMGECFFIQKSVSYTFQYFLVPNFMPNVFVFMKNLQVPISKGPESDKLQGTIVQHFFRINFGTHYSKFKQLFLTKLRNSYILA